MAKKLNRRQAPGATDEENARLSAPRATSRMLQIFETLALRPQGMTLTALSVALSVPKSSLLNLVRPFVQDDFLIADGQTYVLGPASFRHAAKLAARWPGTPIVRPYLRLLAEKADHGVGFAVADWASGRAVYIDSIPSKHPEPYAIHDGISAPLHASAAGHVLLAYASEDQREHYLTGQTLKRLTPLTPTDPNLLRQQIAQTAAQGYWISVGEIIEGVTSIAAPVFDPDDKVIGALMVGAPMVQLEGREDEILELLLELARRASGRPAPTAPAPGLDAS